MLVAGTEIALVAPPTAAALSTLSLICSAAWYLAGTSASIAAVSAVPEMVNVAVAGVEEVVETAVEGSKLVVRCVSIGIMIIATIAIVKVGCHFLSALTERLSGRAFGLARTLTSDRFLRRYGGRLQGGGKRGELCVNEAFGNRPYGLKQPDGFVAGKSPVEPER